MLEDKLTVMRKHYGTDDINEYKKLVPNISLSAEDTRSLEEVIKMPWPYYAQDSSLPDIPTAEDVEKVDREVDREVYLCNRNSPDSDHSSCDHVYRVKDVYAVKVSRHVHLAQEAENLIFLQEHAIRTPKIYAAFSHRGADPFGVTLPERGKHRLHRSQLPTYHYVVTEYLDGVTMCQEHFDELEMKTKEKIYYKVAEQLKLLRSIPAPDPPYYGRIHHQSFPAGCQFACSNILEVNEPIDSYKDLLQRLSDCLEIRSLHHLMRNAKVEDFSPREKLFASVFLDTLNNFARGGEPCLRQGGNGMENFRLVRPKSNPESDDLGDYDVCMVHFEHMAWLPAWAEIVTMMGGGLLRQDEDHNLELILSKAFDPYYRGIATFYRECYKEIVTWFMQVF